MAKVFVKAPVKAANRTSLQGYINVSYAKLRRIFGKPGKGDKHKTDAEWVLRFNDGTIATVYNWMDGKNYQGKKGKPVSEIRNWHVGGRSKKAVALVRQVLGV